MKSIIKRVIICVILSDISHINLENNVFSQKASLKEECSVNVTFLFLLKFPQLGGQQRIKKQNTV